MTRTLPFALAVLALACLAVPALADALDAYRGLDAGSKSRLLTYARAEIEHACAATRDSTGGDAHVPDWPGPPSGVYLSLAGTHGARACVGSLTPLDATLAGTLRELARRVVSDDPRRPPLRGEELDSLAVVVSFAAPPVPVADPMVVSPAREGLLITSSEGSVAFLPGEARTVSWALKEARRIGVLHHASDASFQRFQVVAFRESAPLRSTPRSPSP